MPHEHHLLSRRLSLHQHATISTDNLTSTPSRVRGDQHAHDAGDIPHIRWPAAVALGRLDHLVRIDTLPGPHERRVLDPALDAALELVRVGGIHGPLDGAGVHGVDGGVLRQLPGPDARHGLDGGLGPAVDGLAQEAAVGADGGEADDAAGAVGGEVGLGGLDEEERAEDVDAVRVLEVLDLDVRELVVLGDARVVDDYVQLEPVVGRGGRGGEVVPRGLDEGPGPVGRAQVGLHAQGLDAVCRLELLAQLCREGLG